MFKEITGWPPQVECPHCGAHVIHSHSKAYCRACFWNLENVRRHGRRQVRNGLIGCLLFAAAALIFRLGLPLVAVGLLGLVGYTISAFRLLRLPSPAALPLSLPVSTTIPAGTAARPAILRKAPHWKWKLAVHPLLLAAMTAVFASWFYLDTRALSVLPKPTLVFGLLFAYALYSEIKIVVSDLRQFWLERRLARSAVITLGQVVAQEPRTPGNRIRYHFHDQAGAVKIGSGDDPAGKLYEDMQISVVFDPHQPQRNVPLPGMRFFTAEAQA